MHVDISFGDALHNLINLRSILTNTFDNIDSISLLILNISALITGIFVSRKS